MCAEFVWCVLCVYVLCMLWTFCEMSGVCLSCVHCGLYVESMDCMVSACVRFVHCGECVCGEWRVAV